MNDLEDRVFEFRNCYRLSMDLTPDELESLIHTLQTGERGTVTKDLLERIQGSVRPMVAPVREITGEKI